MIKQIASKYGFIFGKGSRLVKARVSLEKESEITLEELLYDDIKSFKIGNIVFTKTKWLDEDNECTEHVIYNFTFGNPKTKLELIIKLSGLVLVNQHQLFKKVGDYDLDEPIKNVFSDIEDELQGVINNWNHYLKYLKTNGNR
jgi:hypothetical protein